MKKIILVGCLIGGYVCGATFNTIEQAAIDKARQTIGHELETAHKKRCVVAGLGVAAFIVSSYCTYKMYNAVTECVATRAKDMKTVSVDSSLGYFARMRSWIGEQKSAVVDIGPALLISSWVSNSLSVGTQALVNRAESFYRPLDWYWMMRERAPLVLLAQELKQCAAVLDPSSEVFSLLAQVKINCDGQCTAMTADGWIQVSTIDELVKLRMLAQTTSAGTRAVYEQQVAQIWNNLIDRVVLCLGFIAYKQQAGVENEFDTRLLATMSEHLIANANALAKQLPALMNAQNQPQSSGLLAAVYRYSTDLLHCCEIVTSNSIVAG